MTTDSVMTAELDAWLCAQQFSLVDLDQSNAAGVTPLILASQQGQPERVAALLERRVRLDALDGYGNNALWAACYSGNRECIAALIAAGIDLDYQNSASGATALIFAASSGRDAVVQQLLDAGANPRLKTHDDFSALELASTRSILRLLLIVS